MQEFAHPQPVITSRLGMFVTTCALCFGTEAIGGLLTASSVREWYPDIRKPSWTPPDWVFGPVWTVLFLLMAVSAWMVWDRTTLRAARVSIGLFLGQLILNAGWSGLFFALRSPGIAFVEILVLWVTVAATLVSFGRVSLTAASLLLPYLLWLTYATALNGAIWLMNS